jgi:hypothetical protein
MNVNEAIAATLDTSSMVLTSYVQDLSDTELLTRPGEGCNHLAWQLGHLISSEAMLLEMVAPGAAPPLPEGFAEKHSKAQAGDNNPANFCTKQEYLELLDEVHGASKAALANATESDLDQPGPESFRQMCPTVGHVWVLLATHGMMHAGQCVPVRRKLGKPVVI